MSTARRGLAAREARRTRRGDLVGLDSLDIAALVALARSKGINASPRWKRETIVGKLRGKT